MKDKAKKALLISTGALLCAVLIIGIASRISGQPQTADPALKAGEQSGSTPIVGINEPDKTSGVTVSIGSSNKTGKNETDPGTGADSSGTGQTIQADPVKPSAPDSLTDADEDHDAEDVPESERNAETPPTYTSEQTTVTTPSEPEAGSTNESGQVYVPGFGYVDNSGSNQVVEDNSIYENGNKIGNMGGN
ncbi:DUF6550 family protein [uncultured Oscillibacter sp.]|uniref:DUF6550 family protein n=1 Tax=uncultured Oscillibacter sp. TaxID=876091 RepID=UPI0025EA9084|nr:DUF6550 family protein [uncultured Oscillibacter sp.]